MISVHTAVLKDTADQHDVDGTYRKHPELFGGVS